MMNTFFFGYLPLKWKRLLRVLSFLFVLILIFIYNEMNLKWGKIGSDDYHYFFAPFFFSVAVILLISWIVKPFVTKEQ